MLDEDRIFWERMAEMPFVEQEEECAKRRENLALVVPILQRAMIEANARGDKPEAARLGAELFDIGAQNQMLNERLRHIRRLVNEMTWRAAIEETLGAEAYAQVRAWKAMKERAAMPFPIPA